MNDNLLMAKVSTLYYKQNLSKKEIGENLRISRFKVAKLLEDAVRKGVVTITIKEPENSYIELENQLEKKYKIYRVSVVNSSGDYDLVKKDLGRAAANCLTETVHDGDTIGIAWGTTIYEMVNSLPNKIEKKRISVVQLTGGLNQVESRFNAIELSSRISKKFNANCYHLFAPAVVDTKETRELLFRDSNIKQTLDMFQNVNIGIVGIGILNPEPSTLLYKEGYLKQEDIEKHMTNCAVGDINTYFYDINGETCNQGLGERAVGMNLEQLKRVRYVMGVAGGAFKVNAIYAALRGKIINILVTDLETAQKLLKM